MIARFDHRPMLTAALALATIVLLVVVVTLSTLLITAAPPASPTSNSGGNPGAPALPADRWDAGGKSYGQPIKARAAQPAQAGGSVERHAKPLEDYPNYRP
jgi:hypothetical protein